MALSRSLTSVINKNINISETRAVVSYLINKNEKDAFIIMESLSSTGMLIMMRLKFVRAPNTSTDKGMVIHEYCSPTELQALNNKYYYQSWQISSEGLTKLQDAITSKYDARLRYVEEQTNHGASSTSVQASIAIFKGKSYNSVTFMNEMLSVIKPYFKNPNPKQELLNLTGPFSPIVYKTSLPIIREQDLHFDEKNDKLGEGGMGVVFKATWANAGLFAVKKMKDECLKDKKAVAAFRDEAELMHKLRHPNLIVLWGLCCENSKLLIVMDFMAHGSLYSLLYDEPLKEFPWTYPDQSKPNRCTVARDVMSGIACLHENKIMHRDLKSPNVLLKDGWHAVVSDYGIAREVTADEKTTQIGSILWMAPEVLLGEKNYDTSIDIYSLAILLLEIAGRKLPYEGLNLPQLIGYIQSRIRPNIPVDCPTPLADLIGKCWRHDPKTRPTIEQVIDEYDNEVVPALTAIKP